MRCHLCVVKILCSLWGGARVHTRVTLHGGVAHARLVPIHCTACSVDVSGPRRSAPLRTPAREGRPPRERHKNLARPLPTLPHPPPPLLQRLLDLIKPVMPLLPEVTKPTKRVRGQG